MHLALLNPEPSKQSQHACQYFGRGRWKSSGSLHTYWHTSVPFGKVSHLPPLRQDSASCVHRKPANRRRALPTAQVPGGSGGVRAASPGVTRTGDRLAETPGAGWGDAGWRRRAGTTLAPAWGGSPKNKLGVGCRVGSAFSSSGRTDREKPQIRLLSDKCHLGKTIRPRAR